MEIWKDIKNYEDCYEVSNQGRVRRKDGYVNTGIKNSDKKFLKGKKGGKKLSESLRQDVGI